VEWLRRPAGRFLTTSSKSDYQGLAAAVAFNCGVGGKEMAVRAKKLGWRMLHELTTIVTPATLLAASEADRLYRVRRTEPLFPIAATPGRHHPLAALHTYCRHPRLPSRRGMVHLYSTSDVPFFFSASKA